MKKAFLLIALLTAAVFLAACADEAAGGIMTEIADANETTQKVTAEYMGMSDQDTYEVRISENTYKILKLTEKTRAALDKLKLKMGDKVAIEYVKNNAGQLETKNIEKVREDRDASGKYLGLADNNTFEMQIDNNEKEEFKVFTLTDKVRAAFESLKLKKGDRITVNYTENKQGQLLVNSVKRAK